MKSAVTPKASLFSSLLAPLTGADRLALEKARLEAFLNAFPGEYCGFHKDGSVAYSEGFCALLGLDGVKTVEDVQGALETGDAAVLEGLFLKLEQENKPFSIRVHTEGRGKALRIRGASGAAIDGRDSFRILWVEDISEEDEMQGSIRRAREAAERELGLMKGGLETLSLPVWLRDSTGDLIWVNKAYAGMMGTVPSDAAAGQMEITVSSKTSARAPKDLARDALAEGKPQISRCHVISGGKRRWMELQETPLPGTHQTFGLARDLTREEEIQAELDRHLAANKTLLEQLRSAVAIFSADYSLEFFNSAYAAQWGLQEGWLNTKPKLGDILEKLRESRRLPEQADFRKYKQGWLDRFTNLIDPHEEMLYLPDGSAVRLLVVPHPMGGLMMTFDDVTSRLELESNYNTLIAVQKETLDNLAEGVAVYGGDGRLKLWNPSFAKIWDLHPEDLEGGPHITKIVDRMQDFFIPEEWAEQRRGLVAQGLERRETQGRMTRTDGLHLWHATMPLPDGGVMVTYFDVSDSTRVEHALREKNAALEAAEQLKTDFLANVSYQFRTPLNAIMGFSEILQNQYFGPLNPKQTEYTSGIHESGQRLIALIDDILDLSTIEAGYLELKKETVPIQPLLKGLYDLTMDWAGKRQLTVRLDCPDNILPVLGDEQRLKQALLNLIRNAINFTPENGKIEISASQIGDKVEILIRDSGIGIAPDDLKRIFQPFEKISSAKATNGNSGAGLGLALVKNIIELHGGTIKIESRENAGTTVKVIL